MTYISAYPAIKKFLLIKCSNKDINNNLHYLKNLNNTELLELYKEMEYNLGNKRVFLKDDKKIWDSYCNEIVIFFCIKKAIFNIDIPFITGPY